MKLTEDHCLRTRDGDWMYVYIEDNHITVHVPDDPEVNKHTQPIAGYICWFERATIQVEHF